MKSTCRVCNSCQVDNGKKLCQPCTSSIKANLVCRYCGKNFQTGLGNLLHFYKGHLYNRKVTLTTEAVNINLTFCHHCFRLFPPEKLKGHRESCSLNVNNKITQEEVASASVSWEQMNSHSLEHTSQEMVEENAGVELEENGAAQHEAEQFIGTAAENAWLSRNSTEPGAVCFVYPVHEHDGNSKVPVEIKEKMSILETEASPSNSLPCTQSMNTVFATSNDVESKESRSAMQSKITVQEPLCNDSCDSTTKCFVRQALEALEDTNLFEN